MMEVLAADARHAASTFLQPDHMALHVGVPALSSKLPPGLQPLNLYSSGCVLVADVGVIELSIELPPGLQFLNLDSIGRACE